MSDYRNTLLLIERLHSGFLHMIKMELDTRGIQEVNNVQAIMLHNLGEAEMTVGELTLRGCYLGSNVSYNVKQLVARGYMVQQRSEHDRRSIRVRLTGKGQHLCSVIDQVYTRHMEMMEQSNIHDGDLASMVVVGERLDRLWTRSQSVRPAPVPPMAVVNTT